MIYIYPLLYLNLIMALTFFFTSFLILIRKRPLIISASLLLTISVFELLTAYILSLAKSNELLVYLPFLILLIITAFLIGFRIRSLMVYGITFLELQDKITSYLISKNTEFENINGEILIKNNNLKLLFTYNDKLGFAKIKIVGKNSSLLINNLIDELRQSKFKVNLSYSVFTLINGIISLIVYFFVKSFIS
jgi:hypothetical protein